jgi:anthranilate phosphoribosyltransferase
MDKRFNKLLKAVGSGVKNNHNLSQEEMKEAFSLILNKEVYPEQISAFLLGWRVKPETVEEFKGVLDAFDNFIYKQPILHSVEIGYPYDGKLNNPYLFTLMAQYIQKYNLNLVVSGDKLQPAKGGITTQNISNNMNLQENLYYFDRKDYFKELSELTTVRERLGIRTGLNSIERLLNPTNATIGLLGVFHKPFVKKYIDIFADRYQKLVIIKGNEGTPEIFSKCKYWIIEDNKVIEDIINPEDFGINYKKSWDKITLEESLEMIHNPSEELIKLAKLNLAMILFVDGKFSSIKDAYDDLISI